MKLFFEKKFPLLVRAYRFHRDRMIFFNRQMRTTSLGFDFIGVNDMPESRVASAEIQLLLELLSSKQAFIDVGANCGLFSLVACKAGVHTLSFEPNSENYKLLLRNLYHNQINIAETFHVGLSVSQGVMYLWGGVKGLVFKKIGAGWQIHMPDSCL